MLIHSLSVSVSKSLSDLTEDLRGEKRPHMMIVCSGERVESQASAILNNFLRQCRRYKVAISALGTATWILANSGLLNDTACTIHWNRLAALIETFGRLHVNDSLYVRDGNIVTCAGEFACFDFAMDLIDEHLGKETASAVCRYTTADRWRSASEKQWAKGAKYAGMCKKVSEAICLMEQHIEDPLPLCDIARCIGLSRRQIERLFNRYVACAPMRYYQHLRLEWAKRLAEQTNLSVVEIAIACGFTSPAHFSRCFREFFGSAPSTYREQQNVTQ